MAPQPTLSPSIGVPRAREAIDWYVSVFGARITGDVYEEGGLITHAELVIGDSVLMLAELSVVEEYVAGETGRRPVSGDLLVLAVPDVDAVLARAAEAGAEVTRPASDEPYGRTGVLVDPFDRRWMVQTPTPSPAADAHGEVAYLTYASPDDERFSRFFGALLGWHFTPGSVPRGWQVPGASPASGLAGGATGPGVSPTFVVDDVDAAVRRVRELGGSADDAQPMPYGRLAECVDDQGFAFSLLQSGA